MMQRSLEIVPLVAIQNAGFMQGGDARQCRWGRDAFAQRQQAHALYQGQRPLKF